MRGRTDTRGASTGRRVLLLLLAILFLSPTACRPASPQNRRAEPAFYLRDAAGRRPLTANQEVPVGEETVRLCLDLPGEPDLELVRSCVEVEPADALEDLRLEESPDHQIHTAIFALALPDVGDSATFRARKGFPLGEGEQLGSPREYMLSRVEPVTPTYELTGEGVKSIIRGLRQGGRIGFLGWGADYWTVSRQEFTLRIAFNGPVDQAAIEEHVRLTLQDREEEVRHTGWPDARQLTALVGANPLRQNWGLLHFHGIRDSRGIPLHPHTLVFDTCIPRGVTAWSPHKLPRPILSATLPAQPRPAGPDPFRAGSMLLITDVLDVGDDSMQMLWRVDQPSGRTRRLAGPARIREAWWLPNGDIAVCEEYAAYLVDSKGRQTVSLSAGTLNAGMAVRGDGRIALLTVQPPEDTAIGGSIPLDLVLFDETGSALGKRRNIAQRPYVPAARVEEALPVWDGDDLLHLAPSGDEEAGLRRLVRFDIDSGETERLNLPAAERVLRLSPHFYALGCFSGSQPWTCFDVVKREVIDLPDRRDLGLPSGYVPLGVSGDLMILDKGRRDSGPNLVAWDMANQRAIPLGSGLFLGWRDGEALWADDSP